MKPIYYLFAGGILLLSACHKEYSVEPPGGSGSGGTGAYFPSTTGSTWNYNVTTSSQIDTPLIVQDLDSLGLTLGELDSLGYSLGSIDSLVGAALVPDTSFQETVTCTGQDSVIGGISYVTYSVSTGGEAYLSKNNGIYTLIGGLIGTSASNIPGAQQQQLVILKDNQPVGTTWSDSLTLDGYPDAYNFDIVASGITQTVGGTTYSNVIEVQMSLGMPIIPIYLPYLTVDLYFAQNVGLIESTTVPSVSGISETTILTGSTIK